MEAHSESKLQASELNNVEFHSQHQHSQTSGGSEDFWLGEIRRVWSRSRLTGAHLPWHGWDVRRPESVTPSNSLLPRARTMARAYRFGPPASRRLSMAP